MANCISSLVADFHQSGCHYDYWTICLRTNWQL